MNMGVRILLSLTIVAVFLSSCSGGWRVEKRRYSGGFYLDGFNSSKNETGGNDSASAQTADSSLVFGSYPYLTWLGDGNPLASSMFCSPGSYVYITITDTVVTIAAPVAEPQDTISDKKTKKKFFQYTGPPEAKRLTTFFWVCVFSIVLALLLIVLSFLIYPGIWITIASSFLGVGGFIGILVVGLIAAIRQEKFKGNHAVLQQHYAKLTKRALIVVLSVILLYVLYIAGIILLLTNGW